MMATASPLSFSLGGGAPVTQGQHVPFDQISQLPTLRWPSRPGVFYTVLMGHTLSDAPGTITADWLVVNIPNNDFDRALNVFPYQPPPPGSRVGILVYEQPDRIVLHRAPPRSNFPLVALENEFDLDNIGQLLFAVLSTQEQEPSFSDVGKLPPLPFGPPPPVPARPGRRTSSEVFPAPPGPGLLRTPGAPRRRPSQVAFGVTPPRYILPNSSLDEQQAAACRCVLHTGARQSAWCLEDPQKRAGQTDPEGATCSDPFAVCVSSTGVPRMPDCTPYYDFRQISDPELLTYARMHKTIKPTANPWSREQQLRNIAPYVCGVRPDHPICNEQGFREAAYPTSQPMIPARIGPLPAVVPERGTARDIRLRRSRGGEAAPSGLASLGLAASLQGATPETRTVRAPSFGGGGGGLGGLSSMQNVPNLQGGAFGGGGGGIGGLSSMRNVPNLQGGAFGGSAVRPELSFAGIGGGATRRYSTSLRNSRGSFGDNRPMPLA